MADEKIAVESTIVEIKERGLTGWTVVPIYIDLQ